MQSLLTRAVSSSNVSERFITWHLLLVCLFIPNKLFFLLFCQPFNCSTICYKPWKLHSCFCWKNSALFLLFYHKAPQCISSIKENPPGGTDCRQRTSSPLVLLALHCTDASEWMRPCFYIKKALHISPARWTEGFWSCSKCRQKMRNWYQRLWCF